MTHTTNQDYIIMQALWRKALDMGKDGVTIPCGSQQAATRFRFALYASVRVFRKGLVTPDQKLAEAISGIAISYSADKCSIRMTPKTEQGVMPMLLGMLDKSELKSVDELAAEEAGQRFAKRMQEPEAAQETTSTPTTVNPYYTR